jgi:alcohol dehydrogenase (cytochrome c)
VLTLSLALASGCAQELAAAAPPPGKSVAAMPDGTAAEPTSATLLGAASQTQDWILPGHDYGNNRYFASTITPANVAKLAPAWSTRLADDGEQEAAPIVWHGIMYLSTPHDHVVALDAKTGALVWDSPYTPASILDFAANRGVGIAGGRIFIATQDCRIRALDAKTGKQIWSVVGCSNQANNWYSMPAYAYRDTILIGVAGGDFGGNGSVQAFKIADGTKLWEWKTIPDAGQPGHDTWPGDSWKHGGAALWGGLSVDPQTDTVFVAPGNPGPDFSDANRKGKNLYADSVVALAISNATPKVKWSYALLQNDTHDDDPAMPPALFTGKLNGRATKLVAIGDKAGDFAVLDRTSGALVHRLAVNRQLGINTPPSTGGDEACPNHGGGVEWLGGAYDPATNYYIVPTTQECGLFKSYAVQPAWRQGQNYRGGPPVKRRKGTGLVNAVDVSSGRIVWSRPLPFPAQGGAAITSTGLTFTSDLAGNVYALDTKTGKLLWHRATGSAIVAPVAAYRVDGAEYVAVVGGEAGNQTTPNLPASKGSYVTAYRVGANAPIIHSAAGQSAAATTASAGTVQAGSIDYTPAQVSAGKKQYATSCTLCHGAQLQGVSAPALAGSAFGKSHLTVSSLLSVVTKQMPLTAPGSLSKDQYASILAFLLASNCVKPSDGGTKAFVPTDSAAYRSVVLAGASCPVK